MTDAVTDVMSLALSFMMGNSSANRAAATANR